MTALLLGFLAFAAAAQGVEEKKAELEKLSAQIARIETAVQEKTTDDAALVKLRIDLESFSKAVIDFGVSLRPRLSQINARLEELGPPPQAGEPAEPEQLTQERNALQEEKSIHNSLLSDAETLSIRASQSIDQIGELRRNLFTNTLFQRANIGAAIDRNTWGSFLEEMAVAFHTLTSRIQFMLTFRHTELLLAAGLSILFGIGAYFAVGRTFGAIVRRREEAEEPSYIAKLSLAFWSTVIPSLGVAASLAATFGIFSYMSIFTADTLDLVEALLISCAAIFFIQRLANVLLAPSDAGRRLIMIADAPARMLMVLIQLLAMIHVLDFLFERIFATLSSPLSLTVAKSLISSVAIGIILILIALVKPFRDESTGATLSWPRWIRLPIILVAVFIIAATFIGYIGLARFIATQIVMTGAILATMYIGVQSGHVLADEPVFQQSAIGRKLKTQFSLPDTTLDQISLLLSFLVNIMVILVGLPLILLQWGFNRLDIQTWLYRILTDIQIGTISISIVGIVFGTLVFVVGFFATRRLQRWLDGSVMARSRVDPGVRNSIRTIVGYAGVVLAAMVGLSAAGFDLSSLALVAGALSLGI
ncbi:MAG: mechanosensitive ion channel family protein, partial [Alphaproteobacteria bacterium]|nr:mechanosensitive ion channel family protein [Alphaproteobacteria bacterium]